MKHLAVSRLFQAIQTGDDALLLAEYSIPDNATRPLSPACTGIVPAVTALRAVARRPAGRLPKGQHLPAYFLKPVSIDSSGYSILNLDVVLETSPGITKLTPVTLVYDTLTGAWSGVHPLSRRGGVLGVHAASAMLRSSCLGDRLPGAECRRCGWYHPSMYCNRSRRAAACVREVRRSSRSHSSVAKKRSAIAWSSALPTAPRDGRTPSCRHRCPTARAVY